jgi:hypothetical protein
MTLVLTPQGELMTSWGMKDFSYLPNKEYAFCMIRNLMEFYKKVAKKYLFSGRMIAPPKVACEKVQIATRNSNHVVELETVLSSAWEAADGSRALILVNPNAEEAVCTVEGEKIKVPPLSGIAVDL